MRLLTDKLICEEVLPLADIALIQRLEDVEGKVLWDNLNLGSKQLVQALRCEGGEAKNEDDRNQDPLRTRESVSRQEYL
jgi:hypothetical protein